jgi:M6 family metalloprotease-like protein
LERSLLQRRVDLHIPKAMKKSLLFSLPIALTLASCTAITFPSISSIDSSSSGSSTSSISESSLSSQSSSSMNDNAPFVPESYDLVQDTVNFWSIPSLGSPKVLVVPVDFPNNRFANTATVQSNIEKAFNGAPTSSFQSLNSFYKTSSFNKLNLQGDVLDIFTTTFNDSYYENLTSTDPNTVIINEIMNFYNGTIDFSDYDYNADGNLDGIYMIYNHPAGDWASFWWAYLWAYQGNSSFDGVSPTAYIWMPYEFVATNNGEVDALTFIHETGHMLGLEDFYDYEEDDGSGNEFGLGGADMMDSNAGDHNPWSKMILGWIDPLVVDTSMQVDLSPYISSGQALLITEDWNGTLFDEYIIAMYFTPTGFYTGDDYFFDGQSGMVLYHVDARLGTTANVNSVYPSDYINNNSDTPNKLIKFIESDGNNSLMSTGFVWAEDVYRPGHTFNGNRNAGYRFHQSSLGTVDFTVRVVSETSNNLRLNIQY